MGSVMHELNSTRTAQWYDRASGTHRSDAWTERLRCFTGLSEVLAEQAQGEHPARGMAQPQIAPRALISEVARRAHFSAHETVYKRFRSGSEGPIARWAGPDTTIKPRNALVAEAKIVSFWPYRADVLRAADRQDLPLRDVLEEYLRALASWAWDDAPLAACRPAGPPACVAEDMQALARIWTGRYEMGRNQGGGQLAPAIRLADKAAQLANLADLVVTSILDDPAATPCVALGAVRDEIARVLAEPTDPVAEQLGRAAGQLHDRIVARSPGELVLTPAQASDLLAALARLSGALKTITEEGLSVSVPCLPSGACGGERTDRGMSAEESDDAYGYKFTTRDETPQEYRVRTEAPADVEGLVPGGGYQLLAGYSEDDNKFGGDATAYVDSDSPLTRQEAQRLAEEAIDADAQRKIRLIYPNEEGERDLRPSLRSLEVIRLLVAPAPEAAVDPAAELTRPALEGLAGRYAASRGLTRVGETPAWRDPGPWFLSTLDVTRSFGVMEGGIGGGPEGEAWYAEDAVRGPGGSRGQWIVARYEIARARRAGGISCAVRRRPGLHQDGPLPRGLTEAPTGDERFDQRYVVGAAGGDLVDGERPWASRLLTPEFTAWLLEQPYGEHGANATCFQLQGGLVCVYTAGWPGTAEELDAFCGRAGHVAAAVESMG